MGSNGIIVGLKGRFFLIGFFLSAVFWFAEAMFHSFVFDETGILEHVFPSKNSNELWMRLLVVSILMSFSFYVQKITSKRKEAEEALKESRELYSTLAESAQDVIYVVDKELKVLYANRFSSILLGVPMEAIEGRSMVELLGEKAGEKAKAVMNAVLASGNPEKTEDRLVFKGNEYWFDTISVPLKDRRGKINAFLGISRDITRRKKIESLIREERDKAQKYLELANTFFLILDREERITLINRKGCELLGCKEEEAIGKNWFDNFIPEEEREKARTVFMEFINGYISSPGYNENTVISKDGVRILAWHNTVFADEMGNVTSILSSGEDITERKIYEEALKLRIEELERFRKATVARELRIRELKERMYELEAKLNEKAGRKAI